MTKNEIEKMKQMDPWTFFSKAYDKSDEIESKYNVNLYFSTSEIIRLLMFTPNKDSAKIAESMKNSYFSIRGYPLSFHKKDKKEYRKFAIETDNTLLTYIFCHAVNEHSVLIDKILSKYYFHVEKYKNRHNGKYSNIRATFPIDKNHPIDVALMVKILEKSVAMVVEQFERVSSNINQDILYILINKLSPVSALFINIKKELQVYNQKITINGTYKLSKVICIEFDKKKNDYICYPMLTYKLSSTYSFIDQLSYFFRDDKLRELFISKADDLINDFELLDGYQKHIGKGLAKVRITEILEPYKTEIEKYFRIEETEFGETKLYPNFPPLYAVGHKKENKEIINKIRAFSFPENIQEILKLNAELILTKIAKEIIDLFMTMYKKEHEINGKIQEV